MKDRIQALIKNKTGKAIDLNDNIYAEISNFVILWSMFENELYGSDYPTARNQSQESHPLIALNIADDVIDTVYDYLCKRYHNHQSHIEGLGFRNNKIDVGEKQKLEELMNQKPVSKSDKIQCILIVIYRYRCTLFHGKKEITQENHKVDNFRNANTFLIECLEQALSHKKR